MSTNIRDHVFIANLSFVENVVAFSTSTAETYNASRLAELYAMSDNFRARLNDARKGLSLAVFTALDECVFKRAEEELASLRNAITDGKFFESRTERKVNEIIMRKRSSGTLPAEQELEKWGKIAEEGAYRIPKKIIVDLKFQIDRLLSEFEVVRGNFLSENSQKIIQGMSALISPVIEIGKTCQSL